MSKNLRHFTQAVYAFDAVVRRVPDDRWDSQTPCDEWTAAQLVDHQCAVLNGVAEMARTGEMARPTSSGDGGPVETWEACRSGVLLALDQQGALQQEGPFWFKTATIDDLVGQVAWDPAGHAWDLATAAGIPHGLSDELIELTMNTVQDRLVMFAESGRTAPAVDLADGAPLIDRFVALLGRQPN